MALVIRDVTDVFARRKGPHGGPPAEASQRGKRTEIRLGVPSFAERLAGNKNSRHEHKFNMDRSRLDVLCRKQLVRITEETERVRHDYRYRVIKMELQQQELELKKKKHGADEHKMEEYLLTKAAKFLHAKEQQVFYMNKENKIKIREQKDPLEATRIIAQARKSLIDSKLTRQTAEIALQHRENISSRQQSRMSDVRGDVREQSPEGRPEELRPALRPQTVALGARTDAQHHLLPRRDVKSSGPLRRRPMVNVVFDPTPVPSWQEIFSAHKPSAIEASYCQHQLTRSATVASGETEKKVSGVPLRKVKSAMPIGRSDRLNATLPAKPGTAAGPLRVGLAEEEDAPQSGDTEAQRKLASALGVCYSRPSTQASRRQMPFSPRKPKQEITQDVLRKEAIKIQQKVDKFLERLDKERPPPEPPSQQKQTNKDQNQATNTQAPAAADPAEDPEAAEPVVYTKIQRKWKDVGSRLMAAALESDDPDEMLRVAAANGSYVRPVTSEPEPERPAQPPDGSVLRADNTPRGIPSRAANRAKRRTATYKLHAIVQEVLQREREAKQMRAEQQEQEDQAEKQRSLQLKVEELLRERYAEEPPQTQP